MAEVESVSRGLEILRLLNRWPQMTLAEIAAKSKLSRGTAFRMLYTLETEGLVGRAGGRYSVTRRVLTLSHGFDNDWIEHARPYAWDLGRSLLWPITLSEYAAGEVVVRETTDRESPFVFNPTRVGFRMSMLATASGRVMLAHAQEAQRTVLLDQLERSHLNASHPAAIGGDLAEHIEVVRGRGYEAVHMLCGRQTAIAVPVLNDRGEAVFALAVRYFNAAMTQSQALSHFLEPLQQCSAQIGVELRAQGAAVH